MSAYSDAVVDLGPAIYWRLDEDDIYTSTALDSSGNARHGTISYGAEPGEPGCVASDPASGSYRFDDSASSMVWADSVGGGLALDAADPWSIIFWHRSRTWNQGAYYAGIGNRDGSAYGGFAGDRRFIKDGPGGKWTVSGGPGNDGWVTTADVYTGPGYVNFIAVTFDGTSLRFYQNGALVDGPDPPPSWGSTYDWFTVGSNDLDDAGGFPGSPDADIGDVAAFTFALSGAQVLDLYTTGALATRTATVAARHTHTAGGLAGLVLSVREVGGVAAHTHRAAGSAAVRVTAAGEVFSSHAVDALVTGVRTATVAAWHPQPVTAAGLVAVAVSGSSPAPAPATSSAGVEVLAAGSSAHAWRPTTFAGVNVVATHQGTHHVAAAAGSGGPVVLVRLAAGAAHHAFTLTSAAALPLVATAAPRHVDRLAFAGGPVVAVAGSPLHPSRSTGSAAVAIVATSSARTWSTSSSSAGPVIRATSSAPTWSTSTSSAAALVGASSSPRHVDRLTFAGGPVVMATSSARTWSTSSSSAGPVVAVAGSPLHPSRSTSSAAAIVAATSTPRHVHTAAGGAGFPVGFAGTPPAAVIIGHDTSAAAIVGELLNAEDLDMGAAVPQSFDLAAGQRMALRVRMSAPPAGGVGSWAVRFRFYTPTGPTERTVANGGVVVVDAAAGWWDVLFEPAHSADLPARLHAFDLWRTDAGAERPIAFGTVNVFRTGR